LILGGKKVSLLKTPQQNETVDSRKMYVKPRLERISLVLDEAILGVGCKATSGPSQQGVDGLCGIDDCKNDNLGS
jgi:hypothetical protein